MQPLFAAAPAGFRTPGTKLAEGREYHGRLIPECNKYCRFAMIEVVAEANELGCRILPEILKLPGSNSRN